MNENFTEEEKKMWDKLEGNCKVGKWYNMDKNRPDYNVLVSTVRKTAINFGTAEIYDDSNTKFRLIYKSNVISSIISDLNPLQSNETHFIDKDTKEKNKCLKSKEMMSNFKGIPGVCSRPDIVRQILQHEEAERKRNMYVDTRSEKREKLKEWLNGNNIHNV